MTDLLVGVYPPLSPRALFSTRRGTPSFPFGNGDALLTHLGRGAVWLGLQQMGLGPGSRLAMPAYHCGSEVEAARLAGLDVDFYRVDSSLTADADDLARASAGADATYVISYFGFPPPVPPPGARVFEDVAHGLFSAGPAGPLGGAGEVAVFCPRKSLGVPDGGALRFGDGVVGVMGRAPAKRILRSTAALAAARAAQSRQPVVRRAAAAVLAAASRTDAATQRGTLTEEVIGEWDLTRADMETAASMPARLTSHLVAAADGERVRAVRRRNYSILARELAGDCPQRFRQLPDGVCPLYFPVLVSDRPRAMSALRARGVRALEIWPVPHPLLDRDRHRELEPLRRGLVALPVHQELEPWHMDAVLTAAKAVLFAQ